MFGISQIAASILASSIDYNKWLNSLPETEAKDIQQKNEIEYKEYQEHKKALEIANASRPRNFWGQ